MASSAEVVVDSSRGDSDAVKDVLASKKFWGYALGLLAVLLVLAIAIIFTLDKEVSAAAIASITTQSLSHGTNQSSVDRAIANSPYAPDKNGLYAPGVPGVSEVQGAPPPPP